MVRVNDLPNFRTANLADAQAIQEIFDFVWPATVDTVPSDERAAFLERHTVEFWENEIEDEGNYCLVEDSDSPRFFMLLQPREDYALLDRLFFLPEVQGRGWGSHLLAKAEEQAFLTKPEIRLWVTEDNVKAQKFYLARGWTMTGKTSILDSLVWLGMSKPAPAAAPVWLGMSKTRP